MPEVIEREATIEDFQNCWSDFYKEANGFRPRFDTSSWTLDRWQKEFDQLDRTCKANAEAEAESQAEAAVAFEAKVAKLIEMGANNRSTAIRWMLEAEDEVQKDVGYLEYCLGLKYGYLNDYLAA